MLWCEKRAACRSCCVDVLSRPVIMWKTVLYKNIHVTSKLTTAVRSVRNGSPERCAPRGSAARMWDVAARSRAGALESDDTPSRHALALWMGVMCTSEHSAPHLRPSQHTTSLCADLWQNSTVTTPTRRSPTCEGTRRKGTRIIAQVTTERNANQLENQSGPEWTREIRPPDRKRH